VTQSVAVGNDRLLGADWFFADLASDAVRGQITDLSSEEFADALDFVPAEV
jgi:hypothetical protein